MKKVTAFIGTSTRRATYHAVQEFERSLKQHGDVDFEYVFLNEYRLEFCRGCCACFNKGEENCPLKDDRDVLLEKMANSDGVIFATPNYAFQVSARMKNFLDRTAFLVHRPRFFGKTCTAIVTQGFFGGDKIRKYLEDVGECYGFHPTRGSCVITLEPATERQQQKLSQEVGKAAERFYRGMMRPVSPAPSLFRLMMFRMARMNVRFVADETLRDYHYYRDKGWFESDYFYAASLGPVKKLSGQVFDLLARQMATHR